MKSNYDILMEKIKEGYVIRPEHYAKYNVTLYPVVKHNEDGSRTVYAEIARNIAMKLKKEVSATIDPPIEYTALNFHPIPVKPSCIRYTYYD